MHRNCMSKADYKREEQRWKVDLKSMQMDIDGAEGAMRLSRELLSSLTPLPPPTPYARVGPLVVVVVVVVVASA